MWNLPDKMPWEAYEAAGRRCGVPATFMKALVKKETGDEEEQEEEEESEESETHEE